MATNVDEISEKTPAMKQIRDEVVACRKCALCEFRRQNNYFPVIGQGNHNASIMLVGEAPGLNEAKTGRPFCGAAGKVLDELLESARIKREEVYIGNILKDRPPGNRNPLPEEIAACTSYLERQIEVINPKIIGALGNFSVAFLLEKYGLKDKIQGISKIHGQIFETGVEFGGKTIAPLYHPAVAVYNANMKEIMKNDFQILARRINKN